MLEVPTGSGKAQALIVSWLYQRRVLGSAPRRLVYALPMRSLVEQTADVARAVRERLGATAENIPVHVLMGGLGVARPCETVWASATVDRAAPETVDRPSSGSAGQLRFPATS